MKRTIKSVDDYIQAAPKEVQVKLSELRKIIRSAAPEAEERISYGMPYYHYKGRLAYFSLAKKHIGLYIPSPIVDEHKNDLKNYGAEGATIRFPLEKKLPLGLIKKLIKARMKKNDKRK